MSREATRVPGTESTPGGPNNRMFPTPTPLPPAAAVGWSPGFPLSEGRELLSGHQSTQARQQQRPSARVLGAKGPFQALICLFLSYDVLRMACSSSSPNCISKNRESEASRTTQSPRS